MTKFLVRMSSVIFASFCVVSCSLAPTKSHSPSQGHIQLPSAKTTPPAMPKLVNVPVLPEPTISKDEQRHTVVVNNVPIRELLFSLARDAKLNLDIASDVAGTVTINAVKQTLFAILERITRDEQLVYEIKNNVLRVQRDKPHLMTYRIDYLNIARSSNGKVSVSTQISSTGQGAGSESGGNDGNSSDTEVTNSSVNNFWDTLEKNIGAIISPSDSQAVGSQPTTASTSEGGSESASAASAPVVSAGSNNNIVSNREAGIIAVRATKHQHKEVQKFIDEVQYSTRRQVLIEATIAEVRLSDVYQAGIDWSFLKQGGDQTGAIYQNVTDLSIFDRPGFSLSLSDLDFGGNPLEGTLRALETFGDVSIMSSPKIMALNNQTALLKVVDNLIYFTVEVNIETSSDAGSTITYETEVNTVPVGFVMSVTPYINEYDSVTLNVRPTISRVVDHVKDPNPSLAEVDVVSEIPVIQVREIESILKVASGDIAVIGGLMQDEIEDRHEGVPVLSKLPFIGSAFRYDNDRKVKTELVIFIKPLVVNHASVTGDLSHFRQYLPSAGEQ